MKKVTKVIYALTLILAFTVDTQCFAQTPAILWSKTYGGSNQDYTQNSVKTSDGGSILAGMQDDSLYHRDILVIKSDNLGNIQWQKTFGGSNYDDAYSIIQAIDGGYIFTGATASTNGDVIGNTDSIDGNIWVVKINQSGIIQWQKTFGGSSSEGNTFIREAADGSCFVSGTTNSNDGDMSGNHGLGDIFITKISSGGILLWSKCYGGSDYEMATKSIVTSNGGLLLMGYSYSSDGHFPSNQGDMDGCALEINASGDVVWSKTFGTAGFDDLNSAIETPVSYLLVGQKNEAAWIITVDKSGNFLSEKTFGGSYSDCFFDIVATPQGGYVLSGATMSDDGDVSGNHNIPGSDWDSWLVVLDSSLNIKSQKCLGGTSAEMLFSIIKVDNDYLLTGNTYSSDGDINDYHGGGDIWVVRIALIYIPLAIKDVRFNATLEGNLVKNTWTTLPEYSAYEVERSLNGTNWQMVNKTIIGRYDDKDPLTGISYYRLKAYKPDGKFEYSNIIKVSYHINTIKVLPTITTARCIISGMSANTAVQVFTSDGRLLFSKTATGSSMDIDLSRYPSALYVVKVNEVSVKVLKQ